MFLQLFFVAAGFSYWMYQGEKYSGISVEAEVEKYNRENKRQPSCNVIVSEQDAEPSEYAQIMVENCKLKWNFLFWYKAA